MKNRISAIKLEHNSYISLHVQLHNQLRQLIISQRWKLGERVPTEDQLSKHLEISRTTVRIALQRAEVEGLIKRTAGRGTFVSYTPQPNNSTRLIGYVTRSFDNEVHRILLSSAETELRAVGYRMIFSNAPTCEEEVAILSELLEDRIEGLLIWPNAESTDEQKEIFAQYRARNIPVIFIDRMVEGVPSDYVTSDNYGGGYIAVNHLLELGHRHIVYVQPDIDNLLPINERYRGYQSALNEAGYQVYAPWRLRATDDHEFFETDILRRLSDDDKELFSNLIQNMESTNPRPTAIFCANDSIAIIVMKAMEQMNLKIPADISIVGFDDISLASYMDIPLTTVAQNSHVIGQVAAQTLMERLEGNHSSPIHHLIPTRLQIRMSTSTPILESR